VEQLLCGYRLEEAELVYHHPVPPRVSEFKVESASRPNKIPKDMQKYINFTPRSDAIATGRQVIELIRTYLREQNASLTSIELINENPEMVQAKLELCKK
jgi:hypothetical protein